MPQNTTKLEKDIVQLLHMIKNFCTPKKEFAVDEKIFIAEISNKVNNIIKKFGIEVEILDKVLPLSLIDDFEQYLTELKRLADIIFLKSVKLPDDHRMLDLLDNLDTFVESECFGGEFDEWEEGGEDFENVEFLAIHLSNDNEKK